MDSLDLPTHQLILDELALNLASDIHNLPSPQQHVSRIFATTATSSKVKTAHTSFLSNSDAITQISLARFASSISSSASISNPDQHLLPVLNHLESLLTNLTTIQFDQHLNSKLWPIPDQLAYALVSSFLSVANNAPQHHSSNLNAILSFAHNLAHSLSSTSTQPHQVASTLVPLFNGFYRALTDTPVAWTLPEFVRLASILTPLIRSVQITRRLNNLLLILPHQHDLRLQAARATRRTPKQPTLRPNETADSHSDASVDTFFSDDDNDNDNDNDSRNLDQEPSSTSDDEQSYLLNLLSHYRRVGRPLSGHLVTYCALDLLCTVIAQALATGTATATATATATEAQSRQHLSPLTNSPRDRQITTSETSDAAKYAWAKLLRYPIIPNHVEQPSSQPHSAVPQSQPQPQPQQQQQQQPNGTRSRILAALPIIGSNSGSAAFGVDEQVQAPPTIEQENALSTLIHASNRTFHDVQRFFETEIAHQYELLDDLYAPDILGASLKLSALCSVVQHLQSGANVDSNTFIRIRTLLSESTPILATPVQIAALHSVGILARNIPSIALPMTRVLRHFVTSPLAIFEPLPNRSPSPVLLSAAKSLANCATVAPGDDLVISTIYNLLNYLGRDSSSPAHLGLGGVASSRLSVRSGASRAITARDHLPGMQPSNSQAAIATRNEDQKRLINLSTITVISRLALEVNKTDVTALTISMLLQRLRNADLDTEAAILDNLVPLALSAPSNTYIDVIKSFSNVSRSAITGGANRRTAVAVQASQLKLARGLGHLDQNQDKQVVVQKDTTIDQTETLGGGRKEAYLVELLQLFAEKGVQLQSVAASGKSSSEELAELNTDLASLLPAISALLEHDDINPQLEPTTEMVSLFRNLWFLSVLFGFASPDHIRNQSTKSPPTPAEAQAEIVSRSLSLISLKTPTLVPETAHNYLESDLEYNSVLKREFSHVTLDSQKKALSAVIPSHASEIKSFSYAQVTFLATIYDLECLRSSMGRPSMILWYFVNHGLNTSSLVGSMQAIADKVIQSFIQHVSQQVDNHAVDPRVSAEVKNLIIGCCHRVAKVREVSANILDKLIYALPSLLSDQDVIVTMLETLTLLRQGCESELRDEYSPVYHFRSDRADISFDLSDSYTQRSEILTQFLKRTQSYLNLIMGLAPIELQGILQRYLSTFDESSLPGRSELGKSIAVDYARSMPISARQESFIPSIGGWKSDASSAFVGELSAKSTYLGEMTGIHLALSRGLVELSKDPTSTMSPASIAECRNQLATISADIQSRTKSISFAELRRLLYRSAALVVALPQPDYELLHFIVSIPFLVFTSEAITTASQVWTWVIGERPEVETKIMVEIAAGWGQTVKSRKGIFSSALTSRHPFLRKTEMGAFNREEVTAELELAQKLFTPHLTLVHLMSSRFQALRYRDPTMVLALVRLIQRSGNASNLISTHPLAREARFSLVIFGFQLIQASRLEGFVEHQVRDALYNIALSWFTASPQWSFGSNRLQISAEMKLMTEFLTILKTDSVRGHYHLTSFPSSSSSSVRLAGGVTIGESVQLFKEKNALLQLLIENEYSRFSVWSNPLGDNSQGSDFVGDVTRSMTESRWISLVHSAWTIKPHVAIQLGSRFKSKALHHELGRLIRSQPSKALDSPDALKYMIQDNLNIAKKEKTNLKWLKYWSAVSPVEAIQLFQPEFENHPMVLQYAMRALMQHPVELTFFYVPQVVQALRDDAYGYVEQFIFETSKISQLFCHQIIWNMKANSFKDDDASIPDPMKPTLDRMIDNIIHALSGEAQDFYEREFGFFNEVTSISGKLKPYIKKSKPEKKAKIDEEMAKIKVDPGVYLPSNADGVVIDLDRKSGRPLQSHAKAPFMATFKVQREVIKPGDEGDENTPAKKTKMDVWQAAIFKVGDDCRQDVLALQVIAMFKNIYTTVGIDLYLNPYRVTATGPGCGVIDVIPNATSRDEMGRAKINHLLTFFIGRYGNVDGVAFQKARINFIQSMAAYSVVCHILQIRDRHNGNMMIDGDGHLVHIDFGFLFDIGPGGMRFEPYSFKLSHEMIDVMGGPGSHGFKMFEQLVVKAFLACRPFCNEIVNTCRLMLGTDLPSFKGMPTIDRLRDRFKPDLTDREAAQHAQWLVKDAYGNMRGVLYDKLQEVTNDIPFAR